MTTRPRARVLVVDDSAFARKVVREVLSARREIDVIDTARDGIDALEKIATLAPDVVTLDLVMPNLDGLGVLAALPPGPGPRVVIVSTASDDSDAVVSALQAGAISAVRKPTALATDRLYEISEELVQAVLHAAAARSAIGLAAPAEPIRVAPFPRSDTKIVVIGASTGGPQALTRVLAALPGSFPAPVAVVLHMPIGYTEAFAKRMDAACALEVIEAYEGAEMRPGRIVVGRAGLHLSIERSGEALRAHLDVLPLDRPHRPSVDVLFQSVAEVIGRGVLGVVLTGMGDDGLVGSRAIVAAGGRVITQSEATCVVYGMPRTVADAGLSVEIADLDRIPEAIARQL